MIKPGNVTGLDAYNKRTEGLVNWRDQLNKSGLFGIGNPFNTSTKEAIQDRFLDADGEIKANLFDRIVGNSTEELTAAAQERKAQNLEAQDPIVQELLARGQDVKVTNTPTRNRLLYNNFLEKEGAIKNVLQTGESTLSKSQLNELDIEQIEGMMPGLRRAQKKSAFQDDPYTQFQLNENKQRRLDRLEAARRDSRFRQDNLQFQYAQLAQADRQRMQDRRDKELLLLIKGIQGIGDALTF